MQDRKFWIVLLLCGLLLALNMHYKGKMERHRAEQEAAEKQKAADKKGEQPEGTDPDTIDTTVGEGVAEGTPETPRPDAVEEKTVELRTGQAIFVFSNHGGGIKSVELPKQLAVGSETVAIKLNEDGTRGVGALTKSPDRFLDEFYSPPKPRSSDDRSVVFAAEVEEGIFVRKKWSLVDAKETGADYRLTLELTVENQRAESIELSDYGMFLGTAVPLYKREWEQQTGLFYHEDGEFEFKDVNWFKKGWFREARPLFDKDIGDLDYAGVSNQFFATIVTPTESYPGKMWGKVSDFTLAEAAGGGEKKAIRAGISLPQETLGANGGQKTLKYEILMGPKRNTMLRGSGADRGAVMNYGLFWFVSHPLNLALTFIHDKIFAAIADKWSWGFAIVLLTILIRGAMWPLQNVSTRSMKRMSKLQPVMKELREKYPDDPQKLNQETMKLYREYGINPLGGCLPLLVQIPIFFGFYRMLQYAVELRQKEFLWVEDLSQPDTMFTVPILGGVPINLLPILMAGTMVLQMSLTPKTGDKMQQRIFMFMPLIFFFFCYSFASALALYWTTSNIFAIAQTLITKRLPEPELKKAKKKKGPGFMERMQARAEDMQRQKAQGGGGPAQGKPPKPKKPRGPRTGG